MSGCNKKIGGMTMSEKEKSIFLLKKIKSSEEKIKKIIRGNIEIAPELSIMKVNGRMMLGYYEDCGKKFFTDGEYFSCYFAGEDIDLSVCKYAGKLLKHIL